MSKAQQRKDEEVINRIEPLLRSCARPLVGEAALIAARVLQQPELLDDLLECLLGDEAGQRARAASALLALARKRPELLQPHKELLFTTLIDLEQWSVRYRLCQIVPRLRLNEAEIARAFALLQTFLDDRSGALRSFALQGLGELAFLEPELKEEAIWIIEQRLRNGTPAMRVRGRRLLEKLYRSAREN
jgi:HEAT repeat protein